MTTKAHVEAKFLLPLDDLKYVIEALDQATEAINGIARLDEATVTFTVSTDDMGDREINATYKDRRWLVLL